MMQRSHRLIALLLLTLAALASAACGSVATPQWSAEAQATQVALAATDEHLTAIAPTNTPLPTSTPVPPTETPAPTDTPVPPTETPAPTDTPVPPTATAEPTRAAGRPGSGSGNPQPSGDAAAGQGVFSTTYTTASGQWACALCHSVTQDELRLIGPGLWNVAVRAETRVEGQNAYQYVRHSILAPNDFIVPADAGGPYPPNLMPQNYQEVLTPEELEDVIAYLFTLK
ncbi:MAG: c-type cytochrome [Anaerolineae bacterium]|nr:c-type cytochrome [Anaerolineae bacterium]NUQ07077.1 c-type cytochrome [Anaerolineae bacterium]